METKKSFTMFMIVLIMNISLVPLASIANADAPVASDQTSLNESDKLSPELQSFASDVSPNANVRVIVQTRAGVDQINEVVAEKGGRIKRSLPIIDGYVAEIPRISLAALASDADTVYVSLDRRTQLMGMPRYDNNLVRVTTGAENIAGRALRSCSNGKAATIAVLDSGIYDDGSLHEDLRSITDASFRRVLAHRNFVQSENPDADQLSRGYDPYGHGTHVAGIAAGNGRECLDNAEIGNFYAGLAVNANLVDLRVVGADGVGSISSAIAAIAWMIANRSAYNIRVANLSFGAAVTTSYKKDPLCQALERAVSAGIVCVVAAGNLGKDAQGKTVYGGVLAPGNDPLAITVGATNSWGTVARSDDTIASYSSRGPSLVDGVIKPDLVAPGTMLRSIASNRNSLTVKNNLTVYASGGEDVYMWLSGTSMAAPVVAGAAALMLEANPGLTPAMVKSILQFTAQPLPSLSNIDPLIGLLTQGAGCLNADAAVRMSQAFAQNADKLPDGASLLATDSPMLNDLLYSSQSAGAFTSEIGGETVRWGDNVFFSQGLAYFYNGQRLTVFKTAGWQIAPKTVLINGFIFASGQILSDGRVMASAHLTSDAHLTCDAKVMPGSQSLTNGWVWSADTDAMTNPFAVKAVWSANLIDLTDLLLSDGNLLTDGQLLSDGNILSDNAKVEGIMAWGDDAPGFEIKRIESSSHSLFPRGKKIR